MHLYKSVVRGVSFGLVPGGHSKFKGHGKNELCVCPARGGHAGTCCILRENQAVNKES